MKSTRSKLGIRRTISLSAAGAMVMALLPAGASFAQDAPNQPRSIDNVCADVFDDYTYEFDDVDADNVHEEAILCAAEWGIALGKAQSDDYDISARTRRDQMASFIGRAIEVVIDDEIPIDPDIDQFPDVAAQGDRQVHADYILKLRSIGVVEGRTDGNYYPRSAVRRDAMATFIGRAIAYMVTGDAQGDVPPGVEGDAFPDLGNIDGDHRNMINALAAEDVRVVAGRANGTYGPRAFVRRDQMASFIMRGVSYAVDQFPDGPIFLDAFVAVDWNDADGDTGTVSLLDEWDIEVSDEVASVFVDEDEETGAAFTLGAGDDAFTVQCVGVELGDDGDITVIGEVDEGNLAAYCELDDDGLLLTIVLLDEPDDVVDYPVTVTATTLVDAEGFGFDLDYPYGDNVIDVDEDTETPGPLPAA
ncbi:S-layer homology domain-containing protein [Egicoccus sp. AB-alg2]|uniref:S-layer homology domain-containing protein n=1 Tax=Egicoccus sp. AB-alg2 TaxID=3242693 RepID=UPI00359DFB6E